MKMGILKLLNKALMKKIFFLFSIFFTMSCTNQPAITYVIKDTKEIMVENFTNSFPVDSGLINQSEIIDFYCFDTNDLPQYSKLQKVKGGGYVIFHKAYMKAINDLYKEKDYKVEVASNIQFYICGRNSLIKDVQSLLVLVRSDEGRNKEIEQLLLCNFKNNKLCSLISLWGQGRLPNVRIYKIRRSEISLIRFENNIDEKNLIPSHLKQRLGLKYQKTNFVYYSLFNIQSNGFISN